MIVSEYPYHLFSNMVEEMIAKKSDRPVQHESTGMKA